MIRWTSFLATFALLVAIALPGCTGGGGGKKADSAKVKEKTDKVDKDKGGKEHDHPDKGPHGGPLADWDDTYHGELVVDHDAKTVSVYILDDKAKKAPEVDAARFTKVNVSVPAADKLVVELKHDPKKSGADGIAFIGSNDFFGKKEKFTAEVTCVVVDDKGKNPKPFRDKVDYDPKEVGDKKKSASLREYYLKPGGVYTAADIEANGNMPATEKLVGIVHKEQAALKSGDKICPISKKKAQPECSWVVQGQKYEFCCPPCVDRFVRYAHDEPGKIKDASAYVHKPM